jgi:MFS family permease
VVMNPQDVSTGYRSDGATGPESRWVGQVLLIAACAAVSQGFARFTYAFVLPQMTAELLGSYSAAGVLGAVNLGSYLFGVFIVTSFGHRVEATRLLKLGLASVAAGLALVGMAPNYTLLVTGMAMIGVCSAAVWIPSAGIVSARAPERRRGVAFGLTTAGIGLSITSIGIVTTLVHRVFGDDAWRQVWLGEAGLAAAILLLQLVWLRPAHVEQIVRSDRVPIRTLMPGFRRMMSCYFLYGASYALFTSYLIAALQSGGLSLGGASRTYSILGLASMVGGLVVGRVSDHLSRRIVLASSIVVTGLLCLVIPLDLIGITTPVAICYGLLMTGVGTVLVAYVSDVVPARFVPSAFGTITLSLGTSQLLAPPIGGWLADLTGSFDATYLLAAATGVAGGLIAFTLPKRRRGA